MMCLYYIILYCSFWSGSGCRIIYTFTRKSFTHTHTSLRHAFLAHTDLPPSPFSFLPFPSRLHLFLPLIGRIWHVGLSGPLVDSSFASREILAPEWKQWTQWKPCNQWCCSCERDWRNRQRAVQWSHAYFTQFYTHIYNVIIYALYTYMIDTNPHRTDEIGSGCLRGDMMWTIEL